MRYKFPEGNKLGGRPKGAKNKATLTQLERRALFDEKISQKWDEVIDELRPEYIADQYLGKAEDNVNIKGEIKTLLVRFLDDDNGDTKGV